MKDFVLSGTLTPKQREVGLQLHLAPADESKLNLIYGGSVIKSFDAKKVTAEEIHIEANEWMRKNSK